MQCVGGIAHLSGQRFAAAKSLVGVEVWRGSDTFQRSLVLQLGIVVDYLTRSL